MPVVKGLEEIKRINVLYVVPKELPKEIKIPPTSRTIKELVNGPVNILCLKTGTRSKEVILYNANNDRNFSCANRYIQNHGTLYGNFIIALKNKDGEYKSLTKEQINRYQDIFNEASIEKMESVIKGRVAFRRALRRM